MNEIATDIDLLHIAITKDELKIINQALNDALNSGYGLYDWPFLEKLIRTKPFNVVEYWDNSGHYEIDNITGERTQLTNH